MSINKEHIQKKLQANCVLFSDFYNNQDNIHMLQTCLNESQRFLNAKNNKVEELIYEMELIKELESELMNRMEQIRNENTRIVITLSEQKKDSNDSKYSLAMCLEEHNEIDNLVTKINEDIFSFRERVTKRNEKLLSYIQSYDISEIITNVDISKTLKQYNLDNIKVTMV